MQDGGSDSKRDQTDCRNDCRSHMIHLPSFVFGLQILKILLKENKTTFVNEVTDYWKNEIILAAEKIKKEKKE